MTPSLQELAEQFARLVATATLPSAANVPAATSTQSPVPAPPQPLGAVQIVDYAIKGFHLDVTVRPGQVVPAAQLLDQHGFSLDTITGVDWMAQEQMEVVYDYFHPHGHLRVVVRSRIPRSNPEIPTIHEVFPGANWHERETHEFFGIRFLGHPNLTPLLLPEDATYHPLRKDFVA